MGGKKRALEGGGKAASAGTAVAGKRKKSKKAKGKTFQVPRAFVRVPMSCSGRGSPPGGRPARARPPAESGVPSAQVVKDTRAKDLGAGAESDSDDDFEAIRHANAAAIKQREHQQRVSIQQKAKAAQEREKQAKQKAARVEGKAAGSAASGTATGSLRTETVPSGKGKAQVHGKACKGKLTGREQPEDGRMGSGGSSDSSSGSDSDDDAAGLDMTRKADPADDDSDEDSGSDTDHVDVTFDSFDPVEADFHGIKMFFANFLDGQTFDSSGLVDIVLAQSGEVGTVLKVMDEDDVYGVISVANLQTASSEASLQQIVDFVSKKCPTSQQDAFAKALRGKTGLIISERMLNVPPELAVPLVDGLLQEISNSQKDSSLRNKYAFDTYLVLTQLLREGAQDGGPEGGGKKKGKGKGAPGSQGGGGMSEAPVKGAVTWMKAEDECWSDHAFAAFEFPLSREPEEGFHFFGKAMLIKAREMPAAKAAILALVGDEALRNQMK